AAIAGLGWFFFAPRKAHTARLTDGVQRVEVVVRGGYHPDVIRVRQDVPVELVFDRQESGDCTSRVVFGDFAVSAAWPGCEKTKVRLTEEGAGAFGFACGMNMVHGTLLVDPAGPGDRVPAMGGEGPGEPVGQEPVAEPGSVTGRSAAEVEA